jgi:hypothetical protein
MKTPLLLPLLLVGIASCSLDDGLGPIERPPGPGTPTLTLLTPVDGTLLGLIDDADGASQGMEVAVSFRSDIDTNVALFLDEIEVGAYAVTGNQTKVVSVPVTHGHRTISLRPAASGETVSVQVEVDTQRPAAPQLDAISPTNARGIELTWTEPGDADDVGSDSIVGYSLYINNEAQDLIIPASQTGDQRAFTVPSRPTLAAFTVDLHSIDDADNVSLSITLTVPQAFAEGIDEGASFTGAGCSGDFNGDELQDIALQHRLNGGTRQLVIYHGSEDSNLQDTAIEDNDETFAQGCTAGDLDGDGDDELVIEADGKLRFIKGDAMGPAVSGYYMDLLYRDTNDDFVSGFGGSVSIGPSLFGDGLSLAASTERSNPAATIFPAQSVNNTSAAWHSAFGQQKTHTQVTLESSRRTPQIARLIAADANGDRDGDLVSLVHQNAPDITSLAIVLGPVASGLALDLDDGDALLIASPAGSRFGEHLAVGDSDADGSQEIYAIATANDSFSLFTYRVGGGSALENLPFDDEPLHLVTCDVLPAPGDEILVASASDLYLRAGGNWMHWKSAVGFAGIHCLGDVNGDARNDVAIISGPDGRLTVAF